MRVEADHHDATTPKTFVETDRIPQRVSSIQFCVMSSEDIRRIAEFQVTAIDLYELPDRVPVASGCLDPRLGISDKQSICQTCHEKLENCSGHFGYISLAMPVFHIGFFKHTLNILQCICKRCSGILLTDEVKRKTLLRMRHPYTDVNKMHAIHKKVVEECKKCKKCPNCGAVNGTVKKISGLSTLKIVHEVYKTSEDEKEHLMDLTDAAAQANNDIVDLVASAKHEDLLATVAIELFQKISDQDCELLWMKAVVGRPEDLILRHLLVPPVTIRPSVARDIGGGSTEDDLTSKLQSIMDANVSLKKSLVKGDATKMVMEKWDNLQVQVAQYINGETPGIRKQLGDRPVRGLCQRLKGKSGRFRNNLSGKRVDFSARTVISPDPNLRVDQVGIPLKVAMTMTFPDAVSKISIEKLRQCVRNGPDVHPGANHIRLRDGSFVKSLAYGDREAAAKNLRMGDIVERHMEDGDIVLFNRQPSLHRVSIMAHRAKILEWRTFRFNTCVCAPYNADFDGDEMNVHLPQTMEAKTEAALLLGVETNLTTPKSGEPLVAASQDFLSASYILTQKNQFFTRGHFCQLVAYFGDAEEDIELPLPTIMKPIELWTGKQVFTMMMRPNKRNAVSVSFDTKEKNYSSKDKHFCPNDGWVAFRDGELISGNIAKKTIGDGSKSGLVYVLLRDHGQRAAAVMLNKWSKFCGRYMGNHKGLSIGISDVTPSEELKKTKHDILEQGYKKADETIDLYHRGVLELRPGCDLLQSLEEIVNGILGRLRESAGQEAMKALPWLNSPRIMADCGSKGSPLNISQMISCVGQQAVGGKRIDNGFAFRTLPHFTYHSLAPPAKGFVANSFYSGMNGPEFFFHMMGGREGLVDTAVKTADTGYLSRRVVKAQEDLSLQYDQSVRNSENMVVQFKYGDDGLHPDKMENNERPLDCDRMLLNVRENLPCREEPRLAGDELLIAFERKLISNELQAVLPPGDAFVKEVREFIKDLVKFQKESITNRSDKDWVVSSVGLSPTQLDKFLFLAASRFIKALCEPGEAVGALCATSVGEPTTQMTLKTFHFSGVSSMNITLGVPRLQEIINAAKNISTPIITARLDQDDNDIVARVVKAGIEKTSLGQVAKYFKEVYSAEKCYVSIELDMDAIEQLKLNVDALTVRNSILRGSPGVTRNIILRSLKSEDILIKKGSNSKLRVQVPEIKSTLKKKPVPYFAMQMLKTALPDVIVQGIASIEKAVINKIEAKESGKASTYELLMEGVGFQEVMGSPGIDGLKTSTNHVMEVEQVLGVEAARTKIKAEIKYMMDIYGVGIDSRHLLLLSDVMTFKGTVLGFTRHGISKMRESVLVLASFETTTEHLFDAAVHGRSDGTVGVSECIIMGKNVPVGTGLPSLFWQPNVGD